MTRIRLSNYEKHQSLDLKFEGICVLRGQNNTGKSAIARAFDSLLTNTYPPAAVREVGGVAAKASAIALTLPDGTCYQTGRPSFFKQLSPTGVVEQDLIKTGAGPLPFRHKLPAFAHICSQGTTPIFNDPYIKGGLQEYLNLLFLPLHLTAQLQKSVLADQRALATLLKQDIPPLPEPLLSDTLPPLPVPDDYASEFLVPQAHLPVAQPFNGAERLADLEARNHPACPTCHRPFPDTLTDLEEAELAELRTQQRNAQGVSQDVHDRAVRQRDALLALNLGAPTLALHGQVLARRKNPASDNTETTLSTHAYNIQAHHAAVAQHGVWQKQKQHKDLVGTTVAQIKADLQSSSLEQLTDLVQKALDAILLTPVKVSFEGTDVLINTHPIRRCGGSVRTVVGIMLKVYYILQRGLPRFIVFDETLAPLDSYSHDKLLAFLEAIPNLDVLSITQRSSTIGRTVHLSELSKDVDKESYL